MTTGVQASFTGGEVSPSLYARVDLARYQTSLRTCRNWIVQRHGGVTTRPGFRFVALAASSSVVSRLAEFDIGATQSVLVEFGAGTVRIFRNGTQPWLAIANPYSADDLDGLRYAQVGAVMVVVHPNHPPRELRYYGELGGFGFAESVFGPVDPAPPAPTLAAASVSGVTKVHEYVVTRLAVLTREESRVSPAASITANLSATTPITVTVAGGGPVNVYRGRGGVYGYVGTSEIGVFLDEDVVPDFDDAPPSWENPAPSAGTYPSAVTHFQQRRWFGGSVLNPQTLVSSRSSELAHFGAASPARDSDGIEVTLAATRGQGIQHLVPLDRLVVLTTRAEWIATAGDTAVLTPNNTGFLSESDYGASNVPPVLTGNGCVYVEAQGTRIRDLVYNAELRRYGGTELSILATHLFTGYTIVDLAWASHPHSVVWCVRNDGVLLALTYVREQDVWGWSQHVTDGVVERIAVVREGHEDALYALIRRGAARHLERLANRFDADPLRYVGSDAAITVDGRSTGTTMTLSGVSWGAGARLAASFSAALTTPTIGDRIDCADASGTRIFSARVDAVLSASSLELVAEQSVPTELRAVATARWSHARQVIGGLSHLIGRDVVVLNDGNVERGRTVQSDGTVVLAYPGAVVTVGLPFVCELETLDFSMPGNVVRERLKNIHAVTLHVEASRGLLAGANGDLDPVKQRESEPYAAAVSLFTGTQDVSVAGTWREPGRVRVVQNDPLPATVLAIIPDVAIGG